MNERQFYICDGCGDITDDPTIMRQREYDGLDSPPYRYSTYMTCDGCGSEEVREISICEECELFEAEPGYDECRDCRNELDACEAEALHDARKEDFRRDINQPVLAKVRT